MVTRFGKFAFAMAVVATGQTGWGAPAMAQGPRAPGLGGYGAGVSMGGIGTGGVIIPYGGQFAGFMPARMGGGASLSFTSRQSSAIAPARRPLTLSSMTGGMKDGSSRLLGAGLGLEPIPPSAMGGLSGGMRSGVSPPSFAYPFYRPPPFFPTTTTTAGMSAM